MKNAGRRCAIYTRKSHEEGLDQAFNSLDAQREAGLDYIKSQKHEGWQVIEKQYDDGGFTGGNMDRPGLQGLLADIEAGKIDVVVVYKVDRLSRSLGDFAQMMSKFDEHSVSFVSVTQQFNTTNSMGRLTLNMLLSFAQFEREVTSERIRDKLAATKKKGLWVTGQPPLGYEAVEKELKPIPKEADLVRKIYEGYLECESFIELAEKLNGEGYTTKRWKSTRGRWHGGKPLIPKGLHRILTNPVYTGKITHKEHVWPGKHDPIVPRKVWDRVQKAIESKDRQTRFRWQHPHLLKGKLKTDEGYTMSPSAVHRPISKKVPGVSGGGGKRLVRYYVSQKAIGQGYKNCPIKTINAGHLDDLVRALVLDHLEGESLGHLRQRDRETCDFWVREMIDRITLGPERINITLDADKIEDCRAIDWPKLREKKDHTSTCLYKPTIEQRRGHTVLTLAIQIKRLDGKRLLLSPEGQDLIMSVDPEPSDHIVAAIGKAYYWRERMLEENLTLPQLAGCLGISANLIRKYLPLINLAPAILKKALTGHLPPSVTMMNLLAAARELDWSNQARFLGLDGVGTAKSS